MYASAFIQTAINSLVSSPAVSWLRGEPTLRRAPKNDEVYLSSDERIEAVAAV